jgi:hypothetical protein
LIPYRTLADPEVQGEGSIDPLGLATLANHLAERRAMEVSRHPERVPR